MDNSLSVFLNRPLYSWTGAFSTFGPSLFGLDVNFRDYPLSPLWTVHYQPDSVYPPICGITYAILLNKDWKKWLDEFSRNRHESSPDYRSFWKNLQNSGFGRVFHESVWVMTQNSQFGPINGFLWVFQKLAWLTNRFFVLLDLKSKYRKHVISNGWRHILCRCTNQ